MSRKQLERAGWLAGAVALAAFLSFAKISADAQRKTAAAEDVPTAPPRSEKAAGREPNAGAEAFTPDLDHPADPKKWRATLGRGHDRATTSLSLTQSAGCAGRKTHIKARGNSPARTVPATNLKPARSKPIDEGNPPAEIDEGTKHAILKWFAENDPRPFETVWFGATKRTPPDTVRWELEYRRGIVLTKRIFTVEGSRIKNSMAVEVVDP